MSLTKIIHKRGQKTKLLANLKDFEIGMSKDTEEIFIQFPNGGQFKIFPVCLNFEIVLENNQDYLFQDYISNNFRSIEVYDIDNPTSFYSSYKINPVSGSIAILNNTIEMSIGIGTDSKLSAFMDTSTPKKFGLSNRTGTTRNLRIICS